jgi:RNA polymerase sigma factor (sigma-70 family)
MISHWVFEGVDDSLKPRLESSWEKELPRIQKLLKPYPPDLQEIRLTVIHHESKPQGSRYEVKAVLRVPTGTLVAGASGRDPEALLDHVADTLVWEIKRHKERARRDQSSEQKTRNRADLAAVLPLLEKHAEDGDQAGFLRLIRPRLGFLRDYVRRELRHLEIRGKLDRGEATVDDVLDEVTVRAWDRFSDRPRDLDLDLWLTTLVDDTLKDWTKQEPRPHVSLEEPADEEMQDRASEADQAEWWADLMDDEERYSLGDLIPDTEGTGRWDDLDAEEQQDRLLSLLDDLPPAQRQAFLLFALEDYSTKEIAKLQDRTEDQVKADIEAARKMLRERLMAEGHAQESGKSAAALSAVGETGGS